MANTQLTLLQFIQTVFVWGSELKTVSVRLGCFKLIKRFKRLIGIQKKSLNSSLTICPHKRIHYIIYPTYPFSPTLSFIHFYSLTKSKKRSKADVNVKCLAIKLYRKIVLTLKLLITGALFY